MNKLFTIFLIFYSLIFKAQTVLDFTIHVVSPSNRITCKNHSVDFVLTSYSNIHLNYVWVSSTSFFSGPNISISIPGNYTVTASNDAGASITKTIVVVSDLAVPISSLSTLNGSIDCHGNLSSNIVATSNLQSHVSHQFISPIGGVQIEGTPTATFRPTSPGTYTHVLVNTFNNCKTNKTFTITEAGTGLPVFNLTSLGNFSLGCGTKTAVSVSINNPQTTSSISGSTSYTLIPPFTSSVLPSGALSGNTQYTLSTPGNYTAVTRDNNTSCETRVPFTITQNTISPNVTVLIPKQIIDCATPQLTLETITTKSANISYHWYNGQNLFSSQGKIVQIHSLTTAPTATFISNYTISALYSDNGCTASTIIPIYQNVFRPKILISSSNSLVITCKTPSLVLTNMSTSSAPLSTLFPITPVVATWYGPLWSISSLNYHVSVAGLYTVSVKDMNNSCVSTSLIPILDGKNYPVLNYPSGPSPFCINNLNKTASVFPFFSSAVNNYTYQWSAPPLANVSGINSGTITTNAIGVYTIVVTNSLSGCSTAAQLIVANCYTGLIENKFLKYSVSIYPNPTTNYLNVELEVPENNVVIKIYNLLGELVKEQDLNTSKNIIDLSLLSNGVYSLVILKDDTIIRSEKLIKN